MAADLMPDRKLVHGRSIRWNPARADRAYAAGHWVRRTLADTLEQAARDTPGRVLVIDGDVHLDCRRLHAEADALARALLARAPSGSVVSFMLPNWYESVVIYLAATRAGMVVNPILPSLRERELQFILQDVDSRLIFVPAQFRQQDYRAMLGRVTATMARPPEVVVLRGDDAAPGAYGALLAETHEDVALPQVEPDAVRMVLYTSGTTGRPKGVMHTHNTLHALISQIREHWHVEPGDRFLVPSPIGHIGGSIYVFEGPLLLGTTAVLMERWDADRAVALMRAERISHMAGATPFLQQLLAAARAADTRLPDLKVFICGGASVPPSLIREAADFFDGAIVSRVYGSTEVPVTTVGATSAAERGLAADTDGRAGHAELKLVNHGAAPAGEGEVHARGPQMLVGYLREEDESGAFDEDGYFRTGDLARFVADRYLLVTGRAKDIIIRNGENISPKEVEDLLIGLPGIAEIAIVGLPDARCGERACAVIVPAGAAAPTVDDLKSYLKAQGMAAFKTPEQIELWDRLPKNDAGKVLKHLIRTQLMDGRRD